MTTIAWDGTVLAADRQATTGSMISECRKLWITENGSAWAHCGSDQYFGQIMAWTRGECLEFPEATPENESDVGVLLEVNAHGELWVRYGNPWPVQVLGPGFATGSGGDFALGAMEAGRNAIEAVAIASRLDAFTGKGVEFIDMSEMPPRIGRAC